MTSIEREGQKGPGREINSPILLIISLKIVGGGAVHPLTEMSKGIVIINSNIATTDMTDMNVGGDQLPDLDLAPGVGRGRARKRLEIRRGGVDDEVGLGTGTEMRTPAPVVLKGVGVMGKNEKSCGIYLLKAFLQFRHSE
jgi:hypothetical protein